MEPKEKKAFEPSGLVPRSIVRTFERFRQQLLPGSETAAIREYRISRYQVLVSARCLFTLLIIPIATNWLISSWLLSPLVEHFWNTQQNEIFLNSYQEERAFAELESFSEKLFFESLLNTTNTINVDFTPSLTQSLCDSSSSKSSATISHIPHTPIGHARGAAMNDLIINRNHELAELTNRRFVKSNCVNEVIVNTLLNKTEEFITPNGVPPANTRVIPVNNCFIPLTNVKVSPDSSCFPYVRSKEGVSKWNSDSSNAPQVKAQYLPDLLYSSYNQLYLPHTPIGHAQLRSTQSKKGLAQLIIGPAWGTEIKAPLESTYDNSNSLKIKEKVQNKILELAIYYNQQTIMSITNIVGDVVSLVTLGCLFIWMKPEITILKSFLIEAIYSLSDTTKSFLLILLTDLLVGFHSPRGWETALELLLKHFGLPENQDFVFLFVATFPVLLDTVFKYWIFRHLNKISPSTVATYHSMIE